MRHEGESHNLQNNISFYYMVYKEKIPLFILNPLFHHLFISENVHFFMQ